MTSPKAEPRSQPAPESTLLKRLSPLTAFIAAQWNATLALMAGDIAAVMWLFFAFAAYTGRPVPGYRWLASAGLAVAVAARILRWHEPPGARLGRSAAKGAALGAVVIVGLRALGSLVHPAPTIRECLWLAAATACLLLALRLAYFAFRARQPAHPLEVPRWVALGAVGFALSRPYYFDGALGSGDAHWYSTMLADFLTQLRAGIFPVWLGQSEFAFNGADSPLRFAPWFQYAGGLVDLLTCHGLTVMAVKNAVISLNGLAGVLVAYACLRNILPRRPGTAALLAAIYAASPAYLAAICLGDQYMTFLTLPFIPVVLNGLWRVLAREDASGDTLLAVGLSGLWLSHPPIAMWTTLVAGFCWSVALLRRRLWKSDALRIARMLAIFLALGSFPFLSVLSLDNKLPTGGKGGAVAVQVAADFPGNFKPVDLRAEHMTTYQVGYAPLLALAMACAGWLAVRPSGLGAVFTAIALIALVALPVPWVNAQFWIHAPSWLVDINNVWPTQRVFGLWAALMLFGYAMVYADERLSRSPWLSGLGIAMLLGASAWAWHEARTYLLAIQSSHLSPVIVAPRMDPRGATLTRYAYSSFAYMPAYTSHGYMDPWLENRILSRADESILVANADTAAPLIHTEYGSAFPSRLVGSGVFVARSVPNTQYYNLEPNLVLQPGRRYALRLEFSARENLGQLICDAGSLHRDYLLPDSGRGINGNLLPRAFGSLPTSSHILPFQLVDDKQADLRMAFIAQGQVLMEEFIFAHYWLYTYEPTDLGVVVHSLMPYRARVDTALPVYLETPRMWLRGYLGRVNGKPVEAVRSHQNLVMIALEPGASEVALDYHPPWWLAGSFWIGLLGWSALAARGFWRLSHQARTFSRAI